MKQTINRYPHFIANSVLKSKDLNDSFKYLDEQSRLCRAACLESGILNGLTFAIKDGKIIIEPGEAINNRGWYASIQEETAYEYAVKVTLNTGTLNCDSLQSIITNGGDMVGYVCFKTLEDALEFSPEPIPVSSIKDFGSMALTLACGKRAVSTVSCSEASCNVNTEEIRHETWPVLVYTSGKFIMQPPKGTSVWTLDLKYITVEPRPLFTKFSPLAKRICPRRIALNPNMGNLIIFRKTLLNCFSELKKDAVRHVDTILNDIINVKGDALTTIFGNYNSLANRLRGSKARVNALLNGSQVNHVECRHLLFMRDYIQAIGEFLEEYDEFVSRYSIIPSNTNEGCLIYLGSTSNLDSRGNCNDITFRSLIFHKDRRFQEDCARLTDMLKRICLISECFKDSEVNQRHCNKTNQKLKAIIGEAGARMSDRPVPCYYLLKSDFLKCWNADRTARNSLKAPYSDATDNDLLYLKENERIYLNGYERLYYKDVCKYINDLSMQYNLGIKVEDITLNNRKLKEGIKNELLKLFPTPFVVNKIYEGDNNVVKKVGNNKYKLFNAFSAYFKSMEKSSLCKQTFASDLARLTEGQPFANKEAFMKFRQLLKDSSHDDIREFCASFYDKGVYDYENYKDTDIRNHAATCAVDTLVRLVNRSCIDELDGAVLAGGIPAGGTVYVLRISIWCIGYAVKP